MKLPAGQLNNFQRNMPNKNIKFGMTTPVTKNFANNNLSFTGTGSIAMNASRNLSRRGVCVVDEGAKIIEALNEAFGKKVSATDASGYFTDLLKKAGGKLDQVKDQIIIPERSFLKDDLRDTFSFIIDLPARITKFTCKIANKETPKWAKESLEVIPQKRAKFLALDIIDELIGKDAGEVKNLDKKIEIFKDLVDSNITKKSINYLRRDERSLNRAVTSTVSAFFAANEVHNLQLLGNSDKQDAEEKRSNKLVQELLRMGLSAGLTFLSIGALNRFTKRNIYLDSLVIAGSALISEIISRKLQGTSILPISSEEAARQAKNPKKGLFDKIANRKKSHKQKKTAKQEQVNTKNNISFKQNINKEQEIFKNFLSNNSYYTSNNTTNNDTENKGNYTGLNLKSVGKYALMASGFASLFFLGKKCYQGDFAKLKNQKDFLVNKGLYGLTDQELKEVDVTNLIDGINNATESKGTILSKIADKIKGAYKYSITKKKTIDLAELKTEIEKLKSEGGDDIQDLLDRYLEKINKLTSKGETTISTKTYRLLGPVGEGVVKGVGKLVNTVYEILSLPARAVVAIYNRINKLSDVEDKIKILSKKTESTDNQLGELYKIINKKSWFGLGDKASSQEILNKIRKSTRNIEVTAKTEDLANLSRTMVTAISTVFAMNEARNRKFIAVEGDESRMEEVDGAMAEQLIKKLINFVTNGTFMNVVNTTFSSLLNNNLLAASIISGLTELTNESTIKYIVGEPLGALGSVEEGLEYIEKASNRTGFLGKVQHGYLKLSGKKSFAQKVKEKQAKRASKNSQNQTFEKIQPSQK